MLAGRLPRARHGAPGKRRRRARSPTPSGSPPTRRPAPGTAPRDADLVVGVVVGGEARAYPVNLLWDESAHTVNDDLGRAPIAVALCPLAGVAHRLRPPPRQARTLEIGHVSEVRLRHAGALRRAHALALGPPDRRGLRGTARGPDGWLACPRCFTTWGRWKALHPGTSVYVAPEEAARGFELDDARIRRVVLAGAGPPRRGDWVVGLEGRASSAAFLLRALAQDPGARTTSSTDRPIVVFVTPDLTTTARLEPQRRRTHADLRGRRATA